jgi:homoserine dehydrogenase
VGTPFLSQLTALSSRLAPLGTTLSLILILRSSSYAGFDPSYKPIISISSWQASIKQEKPPSEEQVIDYLSKSPHPVVLVDNTASLVWPERYPALLKAGISVVTPNKKGFSSDLKLWNDIFAAAANNGFGRPKTSGQKAGYIFHESSVGAGLPVLSTLRELIETGDKVTKVEGVFSGTMSYLFNTWNAAPSTKAEGAKFSEVVKLAKELGYTEPDPRDDLNGVDVARKAVILARLAGLSIESVESFPVESLVPSALSASDISSAQFLEGLPAQIDAKMNETKSSAGAQGKVVRFVGSVDVAGGKVKVGLEEFAAGSAIASLKGSDNVFSFYTERYPDSPLVVQGSGAGGEVTAMGVTGDLIKVIRLL